MYFQLIDFSLLNVYVIMNVFVNFQNTIDPLLSPNVFQDNDENAPGSKIHTIVSICVISVEYFLP